MGPARPRGLAFAMAAARVYPTVKYALGHGKACTRLVVGGESIAVDRELAFEHGPFPLLGSPVARCPPSCEAGRPR